MTKTIFTLIFSFILCNAMLAQYNWKLEVNQIDSINLEVIVKCNFDGANPILAYTKDADSLGIPGVIGYGAKGFNKYPKDWDELIESTRNTAGEYPIYRDSLALRTVFSIDPNESIFGFHITFNGLSINASNELTSNDEASACFYYLNDKTRSKKESYVGKGIMDCRKKYNFD